MKDEELLDLCEELGVDFEHAWQKGITVGFDGRSVEISRLRLQTKQDFVFRLLLAIRQDGYEQGRRSLKIDLHNLLAVED